MAGTTSSSLGRDSQPKYLGVKIFAGEVAYPGQIIVKQRGSKFFPGKNVGKGGDDTLFALKEGRVSFATKRKKRFNGSQRAIRVVNVESK